MLSVIVQFLITFNHDLIDYNVKGRFNHDYLKIMYMYTEIVFDI